MKKTPSILACALAVAGFLAARAFAAAPVAATYPVPAAKMFTDFPVSSAPGYPGVFNADALHDKPAGIDGAIVARDGHFYTSLTGGKRIRFLGVNFCYGACFPTHQQADVIAPHLARLGINAIRFHHMDSQPFPNGIFHDNKLETLDENALDRLDYFIAALKRNGIYADLNLHVSRDWARAHHLKNADQAPKMGKLIGLFDPDLIQAQKDYARALLTHVNPYTKNAYSDEPAVCMVEINNENTFFMWSGDKSLAAIPEPYAGVLKGFWNKWLLTKYGARQNLATAWGSGVEPLGANLLKDPDRANSPWIVGRLGGAAMTATTAPAGKGITLSITRISGTNWHLQFDQPGLTLKKGRFYTVAFTASADVARTMNVAVTQAHEPWRALGLGDTIALDKAPKNFTLHFIAAGDDNNARLSFIVGQKTGTITLGAISLATGGQEGLAAGEDPARDTVERSNGTIAASIARQRDWYDFLQSEDQNYFTTMYRYLHDDLGVHCPVTGTIGMGALGTLSQTRMDFVDAHAYWQHPTFPGRQWDSANWRIGNTPMVDSSTDGTFPALAAIHVAGKPFTVTEYNEPAPNDWQAECVPMIATFAALQDWDAVFFFAWSNNADFDADHQDTYFDFKANVVKLAQLPTAARIFLSGNVRPLPDPAPFPVSRSDSITLAHDDLNHLWNQLETQFHVAPDFVMRRQLQITFDGGIVPDVRGKGPDARAHWDSSGPGTGQFYLNDPFAAVFVGFPVAGRSIALGPISLSEVSTPFVAATVVSADAGAPLAKSPRLLLTIAAREQNTAMQWNKERNSVGRNWGKGPTQIEPVSAVLHVPAGDTLLPLNADGVAQRAIAATDGVLKLKNTGTLWYELRQGPAAPGR